MDEEKQSPLDDNEKNGQPDVPADDSMTGSQDAEKNETSSAGDDLAMPDMDLPATGSEDNEQAESSTDDAAELKEEQAEAESEGLSEVESEEKSDTPEEELTADPDSASQPSANPDDWSDDDAEAAMLKMMEEDGGAETETSEEQSTDSLSGDSQPVVEKVAFQPLRSEGKPEAKNLDMLMDVSLPIAIELGRTAMAIEDILNLSPGSVVELDKLAGEPVDLLVNNKLLAKGEVVVIDENFGVRITRMVSPQDRIRNLQ